MLILLKSKQKYFCNKKNLRYSLPRKLLVIIYKAFLRPQMDYRDIIFDQPQNESFCDKMQSEQYKAALAMM